MKKIFPLLVVFLFICSFIAMAAPVPPYTLSGKANLDTGDCIAGFNILIKTINYETLEKQEIAVGVNDNCEYSYSLGNAPFKQWMEGMKIDLRFCKADKCLKSIVIGEGGCEIGGGCNNDFTLTTGDIVYVEGDKEITAGDVIKKYVCSNGDEVTDPSYCPLVEEEDKNDGDWNVWYTLILSLLGLAAIVFSFYKWGKGFSGLINYRINLSKKARDRGDMTEAKKQMDIAIKMTQTALDKHKKGLYK